MKRSDNAEKAEAQKLERRRVALVRAYKASNELASALNTLLGGDHEASILLKRALTQVQTAVDYLR
jgi:hypothetical protein